MIDAITPAGIMWLLTETTNNPQEKQKEAPFSAIKAGAEPLYSLDKKFL